MTINDPPDNIFIRFKNHIDNNIYRGFQTILTLPVHTENREQEMDNSPTNRHDTVTQQRKSVVPPSNSSTPSPDDDMRDAEVKDVYHWAISSPYSPLNLQSLRQPRPADAPRDYPDCFTFRDAFEDLLAVNSGKPLSDLRRLVFFKHFEHVRYFPWGMSVENWVAGVGYRGLWGTYFPLSRSAKHDLSCGIISPWRSLQIGETTFHQSPVSTWPSMIFPPWEHHRSWRYGDPIGSEEKQAEREVETTYPQEADTEYDLYQAMRSEPTTDNKVVETNAPQGLSSQPRSSQATNSQDSNDGTVTQTTETPDGGKIVKTIEQHGSQFGKRVNTTTKQFNAAGELVSKSQTSSWSWSYQSPGPSSKTFDYEGSSSDDENTDWPDDKEERPTRKDHKSNGWFWK
ncbi:hypothetical protein F4813DRAFT_370142 [Daldinia decipiens]|uniref:uncharacterized protein n=1 Tax=Daldinia decipiens TaxID=326647 RepID=UPI0020C2E141|nr:uncharacterized protein F4813DRAFT_370142 [Daldinia decipiens]KAI1654509.1 hypothetical protein F4813DRAFT_370142 [Daldinia decipiens]